MHLESISKTSSLKRASLLWNLELKGAKQRFLWLIAAFKQQCTIKDAALSLCRPASLYGAVFWGDASGVIHSVGALSGGLYWVILHNQESFPSPRRGGLGWGDLRSSGVFRIQTPS